MIVNQPQKRTEREPARQFDHRKYAKLLAASAPAVIRDEQEYDRINEEIGKYLRKGESITAEEDRVLDLLSVLIEAYDDEHYQIEQSAPHEVLKHLMEARGLKQKDVVPLFGSSGRASEALKGARAISKAQAKKLAEFFHVSAELFI